MLTKMDLESLREYREGPGRVLSVYLDLDQSNAANLNRGFELALESRLRSIASRFEEEYEQREFEACAKLVREFAYIHRPHSRSLVLFARANGSLYTKELNIPVTTDVRWSESAYIQPFVEAVDKFETYAVVLADKSRARIFTVSLGNIELETEVRKFTPVRHIKTAGTDRMFSQSHFQRKADENASSNLRHVVEVLENVLLASRQWFERRGKKPPSGSPLSGIFLLPQRTFSITFHSLGGSLPWVLWDLNFS